ncbi:carbohydrate ABC transporter permease [Streptomyces formicae]|uniref:Carbohydrate ABC transporter permease n=1 Tax=Streptomyces formicae TaxID=1616117 RepID=A0ABY3WQQ8_9ACTN|nr:carbohydrate ABC transporter permease [Streptomyces formicae]UNM12143.1 carbohydrate ABC transporter permease [Streptomyces formicae]
MSPHTLVGDVTAPDVPTAPPGKSAGRPGFAGSARRSRTWASRTAVNGLLLVAAVYTFLPLTWMVFAVTKDSADLFATSGFALGDFNLIENLRRVFTFNEGIYLRWLLNTLVYAVVGSLASTMISVVAGYAFDKYEFPGKGKLFGVVLAGVLVPGAVLTLPMYLLFSEVGLVNTYWAMLLPALVNPFGVYLARVFSEGYVPVEVLEAARVDGASELRTFINVALPMLTPGFVTLFLFSFTASWNNFYGALIMLNDEELFPVNLGLFMWNSTLTQAPDMYSLVITGSVVAVVPLVIAFIGLQRFWRSGLTAGAVK